MVQKEAAEVNPFNRTRLPRQPEITCGIGGYRGGHHLANLSAPVVYTSESDVERRPEFGNVQVRSWA
jgi:hypothetical protein